MAAMEMDVPVDGPIPVPMPGPGLDAVPVPVPVPVPATPGRPLAYAELPAERPPWASLRDALLARVVADQDARGTPLRKIPVVNHRELDLLTLYVISMRRGGFKRVRPRASHTTDGHTERRSGQVDESNTHTYIRA
jgi:hypothetical protein